MRTRSLDSIGKRGFDLVAALVGLVLLSPLLTAIAILIRLDSRGPVFYRGARTGRYGARFRIYKFRTMVPDAESLGGGSTARNDPRVTKFGRFLRRHKLDELPQLLNVIKGEMSLVGPRPELPRYTARYSGEQLLILSVRPGITDNSSIEFIQLGDILGNESPDEVFEQRVLPVKNALRVAYVRTRTFRGDLALIFRTLRRLTSR